MVKSAAPLNYILKLGRQEKACRRKQFAQDEYGHHRKAEPVDLRQPPTAETSGLHRHPEPQQLDGSSQFIHHGQTQQELKQSGAPQRKTRFDCGEVGLRSDF